MIFRTLLAGLLVLLATPALACECREVPLEEKVRAATQVLQGVVVYPYENQPENVAAFAITGAVKGVQLVKPRIKNNFPDGNPACAASFIIGEKYDVIVYGTYESGYYTDACNSQLADNDKKLLMQMFMMRAQQALRLISGNLTMMQPEILELVDARKQGEIHLKLENFEMALRMFARGAQLSRGSWVDYLGQGKAYLKLMMAQLALERFDDVLEKKPDNQEAWSGRYQALGLLDRWAEVPAKTNLTGFWWRKTRLSADLKAPVMAKAWWDEIDASNRKLTGTDFSESLLTTVNFSGADLTGVSFKGATLRDVNFSGANLTNADMSGYFTKMKWDDKTIWPAGFKLEKLDNPPPPPEPIPQIPMPELIKEAVQQNNQQN